MKAQTFEADVLAVSSEGTANAIRKIKNAQILKDGFRIEQARVVLVPIQTSDMMSKKLRA